MPDISSGVPIGDPTMGSMGGGSQSAMPQGLAGPTGPNAQMLKIMGPIALAYLQNMMQQSQSSQVGGSQQSPGAGSNQPGDPITEALENATGQDLDGDQDGTGVQSSPPGGKSLQTAHANQPNNGTIPLGSIGQQGMAMPKGIGGTGGMPFVKGRQPGGSTKVSAGSSGGGKMGGKGPRAKAPPVGKIKTPPKEGKNPPPA